MRQLSILFFLSVVLTANAQIEIMTKHREKADPMTNKSAMTYWESRHVAVTETDDGKYYLSVFNPKHIFTANDQAKVGFYNQAGKLIMMSERWGCTKGDGSTQLWLDYGFTKDSTKYSSDYDPNINNIQNIVAKVEKLRIVEPRHVLQFLKENNGYIRIVTPIYYNQLFDVKARIARPSNKKK